MTYKHFLAAAAVVFAVIVGFKLMIRDVHGEILQSQYVCSKSEYIQDVMDAYSDNVQHGEVMSLFYTGVGDINGPYCIVLPTTYRYQVAERVRVQADADGDLMIMFTVFHKNTGKLIKDMFFLTWIKGEDFNKNSGI